MKVVSKVVRELLLASLLGVIPSVASGEPPAYVVPGLIEDAGDRSSIPEPASREVSGYYDFIDKTFVHSIKQAFDMPRNFRRLVGKPKEAQDVNAFDEAPNSTWFTNRIFFFPPTIEEVERGANLGLGPHPIGNWTVIRGKTQGVTPGFVIKDALDAVYVIKFDPPEWQEMATGAEIISTKIFHLAGYNCPENNLAALDLDRIAVSESAKFVDSLGVRRPMTRDDVLKLLEPMPRQADGTIRVIASKFISGNIKGHFDYIGWRKDDPNDLVRHEHRRVLRGLRPIAAWTLHNDIRSINNLESYVTEEDGRQYLLHYLIDFGATLGSASLFPNRIYEGHEYILDGDEIAKSLVTFGIYRRPFEGKNHPMTPATGYFESELFKPGRWKPNFPNPAFQNATDRDNYWGAKIVMAFTDEIIDQIVSDAKYSRPEDAAHMVQVLRERRDKVGRHWFARVNPADRFRVVRDDGGTEVLEYDDLAVVANLAQPEDTQYRYRLRDDKERTDWEETPSTAVPLGSPSKESVGTTPVRTTVEIQSRRGDGGWSSTTRVELERGASTQIIGIAR
jgi:hypothetical protein